MSAPVISYVPFDELVASLRLDGLESEAKRIHFLVHNVAWTTGSELIGELGQEIKNLEREHGGKLSTNTVRRIDAAFDQVRRV